jgi:hypothetical protein
MTEFPVYAELLNRDATGSLPGWLLPSAIVSTAVLAVALIGATVVLSQPGSTGEAAAATSSVDISARSCPRRGGHEDRAAGCAWNGRPHLVASDR